jgi:hypothetical protein
MKSQRKHFSTEFPMKDGEAIGKQFLVAFLLPNFARIIRFSVISSISVISGVPAILRGVWLRYNVRHNRRLGGLYRFPIGRSDCFGSVEMLEIGSVAGKSMAGSCEAYLVRIL